MPFTNSIKNSGFENGFTYWYVTDLGCEEESVFINHDPLFCYSGTASLGLRGGHSDVGPRDWCGGCRQVVYPTVKDKVYDLTFKWKSILLGVFDGGVLKVLINNVDIATIDALQPTFTDFTPYQYIATGPYCFLEFQAMSLHPLQNGARVFFIDAVSFLRRPDPVVPPSSKWVDVAQPTDDQFVPVVKPPSRWS